MNRRTLEHEAAALRAALAVHGERLAAAAEEMDEAAERFAKWFGFHPAERPEYAPGFVALRNAYEAKRDETGYFYAIHRLADIERIIGREGETLPIVTAPTAPWSCGRVWILGGDTPKAHPSVGPWVAATLFAESSDAA